MNFIFNETLSTRCVLLLAELGIVVAVYLNKKKLKHTHNVFMVQKSSFVLHSNSISKNIVFIFNSCFVLLFFSLAFFSLFIIIFRLSSLSTSCVHNMWLVW